MIVMLIMMVMMMVDGGGDGGDDDVTRISALASYVFFLLSTPVEIEASPSPTYP